MTKKYIYNLDLNSTSAPARAAKLVGENKTVLEIGCASGSQTRILKEQLNCSIIGIEIDPHAAVDAKKYCDNVIVGNIETLNLQNELKDRRFDTVTFIDVLEHLRDPVQSLQKVKPFIKTDGCLIASIPNIAHASVILELIRGNFNYSDQGLLDDTHIRFFTKKTILSTFESAGYIIIDIEKVVREPRNTEFATTVVDHKEQETLNYILENNPESRTYQFIVRAIKATAPTQPLDASNTILQEKLAALKRQITDQEKQLNQLNSELNWIINRPLFKALRSIKNKLLFVNKK